MFSNSRLSKRLGLSLMGLFLLANCPIGLAAKPVDAKKTGAKHLIAQVPKTAAVDLTSPALISVLKDITKALSESSDYNNLSDGKQKAVVGIAINVLQTALANPQLSFNRIISADDKAKSENSMSAETWDSGEIIVHQTSDPQSAETHAAASCIWAKKVNGLVNLTIAGNSNEIVDGQKLGEFIFVASGRSGLESGFDIQSQASVNYWIGKLTQFVADAGGTQSALPPVADTTVANPTVNVPGPAENTNSPGASTNSEPDNNEEKSEVKTKSEVAPSPKAELPATKVEAPAVAIKPQDQQIDVVSKTPRRSYLLLKAPSIKKNKAKSETPVEKKPETKAEVKTIVEEKPVASEITTKETTISEQTTTKEVPAISADKPVVQETVALADPEQKILEPKTIEPQVELGPSADAMVVTPDKAQAGQLITVSVVNARLVPESGVDVDFNGTILTTGSRGQVQYLVPEDSTPGPTLKVSITGRQLATTKIIHILQPLSTPGQAQPPRVDRVTANASKFDTVTIQGHNFNGQAGNLSVTIDGKWEAQILSISPLELKILVPEDVPAGQHSVIVTNSGMKSNGAIFSLISLQVAPDARPGQVPTKLIVRALGTAKPVAVHLRNNTPNIITIVRGNDLRIKTPGGKDNSIAVGVRLKQRGNYNIQASIE